MLTNYRDRDRYRCGTKTRDQPSVTLSGYGFTITVITIAPFADTR
jgi:hypothetical protein